MFQRVVSLLLLPTVLLTQWASAGQCHGCPLGTGHHDAPHIHWWGFPCQDPAPRGGDQSNPFCCCHPHENESDDDTDSGDEECNPADAVVPIHPEDSSTDHHRGSVIYLPTALRHGWLAGRSALHPDHGVDVAALVLDDSARLFLSPRAGAHDRLPCLTLSDGPAPSRTLPLLI